tara:strand:+ start:518 stop:1222 length:705 start_codon:yes stop_codon:yes gene_type:complete
MKNGIIIGNSTVNRGYLAQMIGEYSDFNITENTHSLKNAQNSIDNHSVAFIFVFDDFEEINVFDLVDCWHTEISIIIISNKPELAAKCYAYHNILDFLMLPLNVARFIKCIAKISNTKTSNPSLKSDIYGQDHFFVKTNKKFVRINYGDLLIVEGLKDYILVRTLYDEYIVHANIGNFTNYLPRDRFMRIHKSYTIAIGHIKTVTSNEMEIGPHLIPIGRSYQEKTLTLLNMKK